MEREVGEVVKIKNIDWYNKFKNEDGFVRAVDHNNSFTSTMSNLCGRFMCIKSVEKDNNGIVLYCLNGSTFVFYEWMLEPTLFKLEEIKEGSLLSLNSGEVFSKDKISLRLTDIIAFPLYRVVEAKQKLEHEFKPFEKVIVSDDPLLAEDEDYTIWHCDFFSHKEENGYRTVTGSWDRCLPFEGNEHLLGKKR